MRTILGGAHYNIIGVNFSAFSHPRAHLEKVELSLDLHIYRTIIDGS